MQWLAQKRGELGLFEAAAHVSLGGANPFETAEDCRAELPDIIRPAVGERRLGEMPCSFNRIELRCVGRQAFKMEPGEFCQQVGVLAWIVDGSAIPYDNYVPAQMTHQMVQEVVNFVVADVFVMQAKVKSEPAAARADRQTTNYRDSFAPIVMAQQRCLPAWRPSAAHRRNHHESGFVGKDEVGTQACSVFFTRDHSSRFQRPIFASLRSSARRCGFWQLKPKECSSLAT